MLALMACYTVSSLSDKYAVSGDTVCAFMAVLCGGAAYRHLQNDVIPDERACAETAFSL